MESKIFTPCQIGPVTLRNRVIRSAAFENMAYGNRPSDDLFNYHTAVARGGVGMTTVAYAAVCQSGLSFDGQLWMREEVVPELKRLTDAVHSYGAKASIQLGHCGNMTHRATCGCKPVGASGGFNLYSPTFHRKLKKEEIYDLVRDFGKAVNLARKAGFDCVEIHAGHGYLISQFLSPYTDMAVVVKVNMHDGFKRGMQQEECIKVAQELERLGVHALVLTAGFVSKAPMEVMRGAMPLKTLRYYMDMKKFWWLKAGLAFAGRLMIPTVPFSEGYFLEDAKVFRANLKMPLIYVGGMVSKEKMEEVLDSGFVALQMARALVNDTDFINKLQRGEVTRSECKHSNYCIGRMYTLEMKCHHCVEHLPSQLQKEIDEAERTL